jgi:hypothetical protein
MRAIKLLVLAIVLAAVGVLRGQSPTGGPRSDGEKPTPAKDSLEHLLAEALKNSPEIQLAEAKLREAEALLRQTRLSIMQKVIEQQSAIETQKSKASLGEANLQRLTKLFEKGMVSSEELAKVKADVEAVKAAMKQAELTLNGLTGKLNVSGGGPAMVGMAGPGMPGIGMPGGLPFGGPVAGGALGAGGGGGGFGVVGEAQPRPPHGPMADKIRAALNKKVKIDKPVNIALSELPRWLRDMGADVPFQTQLGFKGKEEVSITLIGEVKLAAAFQMLQDIVPGLQFFAREYGILVTTDFSSADAMPLLDFWRSETTPPGAAP